MQKIFYIYFLLEIQDSDIGTYWQYEWKLRSKYIPSRNIWNEKADDYATGKICNSARLIYALVVIYTLYKEWQLTTTLFYVLLLR